MLLLAPAQFGVVSVAIDRSTGNRYAIKSMSKRRAEAPSTHSKDIRTEVELLYHLAGHPNIVQLVDVYEDDEMIHLLQVGLAGHRHDSSVCSVSMAVMLEMAFRVAKPALWCFDARPMLACMTSSAHKREII